LVRLLVQAVPSCQTGSMSSRSAVSWSTCSSGSTRSAPPDQPDESGGY